MKIFKESGLVFEFSERWNVLKYDEHRFYSYLSGSGFKGVDFIGILDQKQIVLIEVKNYNDRFPADLYKPMDGLLANPGIYAEHYSRKFKDTFQLIDIVRQYYDRKWWHRWFRPFLFKILPKRGLLLTDWGFWTMVIQNIQENPLKINLALWLELPEEISAKQKAAFYQTIKKHLLSDFPASRYIIHLIDSKHSLLAFKGTLLHSE